MTLPTLDPLLEKMHNLKGSDIYLTVGCPPSIRVNDSIHAEGNPLSPEDMEDIIHELLNEEQLEEFESALEFNTAISWNEHARFRVNAFRQQQHTGVVIRRIQTDIPTMEELGLPETYRELIMQPRGLVLVVGPTGSGKSSSLAAMIGCRNENGIGHIITIEDPIEFVHQHKGCIVTQRDVGIDTYSFGMALKNALRQRPDVVLIGEIRDRETMEHAINFAETGHLCVATLHANNSNQAIERVLNFFPEEKHHQVLANLAMNLKGILSQRLVPNRHGTRSIAVEIMLNQGLVRNLIEEGKIKEIKDVMEKNSDQGMYTFERSLLDLYYAGIITDEVAISESDNPANLRLKLKQGDSGGGNNAGGKRIVSPSGVTPGTIANPQHFKI